MNNQDQQDQQQQHQQQQHNIHNFHNEMWRRRLGAGGDNRGGGRGAMNNIADRVGNLLPSKDSPVSIFIGMVIVSWLLYFFADIQSDINVYQQYVIGTCYFQRFHNIEWTTGETYYTFHGIVEVLVNTNKNTKSELKQLYPSIMIMSSQQPPPPPTTTSQEEQTTTTTTTTTSSPFLYLPFRTNLSIEQPVEEISYLSRHPPVEVANESGPFSHPHKCFFHPLTREVSSERSVLPLANIVLLMICTLVAISLIISPSLRHRFDQQVPLIVFFYLIVQLATLNISGTVDFTLKDLLIAVSTRVVLVVIGDVLYEYLNPNSSSRFAFHFLLFILYLILFNDLVQVKI